jgi:hypothetical protein
MTKSRIPSALLAFACAIALAATAMPSAAYELKPVFIKSWSTSGDADLPPPPPLATPNGALPGAKPPSAPGGHVKVFNGATGAAPQTQIRTQPLWGVRLRNRL